MTPGKLVQCIYWKQMHIIILLFSLTTILFYIITLFFSFIITSSNFFLIETELRNNIMLVPDEQHNDFIISVHCKLMTMVSLVTVCHHRKLLQYH